MKHGQDGYWLLISGDWSQIKLDKLPILVKKLLNLQARVCCRVLKPFQFGRKIYSARGITIEKNRFWIILLHLDGVSSYFADVTSLNSYNCKMCIFWQTRKMIKPFVDSVSMNREGMFQPAVKKARMVSSPKVISTQPSPYSFTTNDLQKCLFNALAVHPVDTQDVLVKKKQTNCFCK